jgi:D-amino-acid dehydrogenase
MAKCK